MKLAAQRDFEAFAGNGMGVEVIGVTDVGI